MLEDFLFFVKKHQLFSPTDRILLAVSGGMDSILMNQLFSQANLNFGIAHCNFFLRGKISDEEKIFVENLSKKLNVNFYSTLFQTSIIAEERKQSIQEVARDLRYEWLEQIRSTHGFDYIATAHHASDAIETALFNFGRGSGIRGMHGISEKTGKIIRPMLFTTKKAIEEYVQKNQIEYRYDASNDTDKYSRNKIRHHIIPAFQEVFATFEDNATSTIERLKMAEAIYDWSIAYFKRQIVRTADQYIYLDLEQLHSYPSPGTILYEILQVYGFHGDQIQQMLEGSTGATFYSKSHEVLVNRAELIVRKILPKKAITYTIDRNTLKTFFDQQLLDFQILSEVPGEFPNNPNVALLDYDKLQFPLLFRHWKEGDRFQPLGMQGKSKKVQDYFSNEKLHRFDKENVWLLESGGNICWIVGYRMDERFKIDEKTEQVYRIEVK